MLKSEEAHPLTMSDLPGELWATIGGNSISAFLMLAGGLFVLLQDWRRDINRLFFFLTVSTLLYTVFYIIAALQTDYERAYFWWFMNIFICFIPMAVVHFIFRVINRQKEWDWFIKSTYIAGFLIFTIAWIEPTWYLPYVAPKLYFSYFLVGGWWYVVMLVYFLGTPLVAAGNLLHAYHLSSGIDRKRLEYFILMLAVGYTVGCLNFLLVFDVPVDPLFGMFMGFYLLPIAYGIFATDLLDIRVVVQRTLYYALAVGAMTGFLIALILLNNFITGYTPGFQFWTIPLLVAIVALLIGRAVWNQIGEAERLKYEFITVTTHKLRTPLTRIHWMIPDLLEKSGDNPDLQEKVRQIDSTVNRLVELTNVLVEAAHSEGSYGYERVPTDLHRLALEAIARFRAVITEKRLTVETEYAGSHQALGNARRLAMAVDVLLENAITYTPPGGKITITIAPDKRGVRFAVTDSGIGIKPEDRERIFSKFFRTDMAKTSDTEGLGLGLSLSKSIIERFSGRMGVDSEGVGKGSTFWFTLPKAS